MNFKDSQNAITNVLYCQPKPEDGKVTFDHSVMEEVAKAFYTADRLAEAYIEATEWNFATLSMILGVKRTAKHEITRQTSICTKMLVMCLALKGTKLNHCGRVEDLFKAIESGKTPEQAVQAYVEKNKI